MKSSLIQILHTLFWIIETKDEYTAGHSERVGFIAKKIAGEHGLGVNFTEETEMAGLLHDLGKIVVEKSTLNNKQAKLSVLQLKEITEHPYVGAVVAAKAGFSTGVILGILQHHERFDGERECEKFPSYPFGLKGEEISTIARIVAIADTFDALNSGRSYQKKMSMDEAIKIITDEKGKRLDPAIVEIFINKCFADGKIQALYSE